VGIIERKSGITGIEGLKQPCGKRKDPKHLLSAMFVTISPSGLDGIGTAGQAFP